MQTWERLIFFRSDSTQSQKVLILTQLMTHNGFQEFIHINSRFKIVFLEFDSNRLTIQMAFQNFDSNRLTTHKVFQNFNSNQLTTQKAFQDFDSYRFTTEKPFGILVRINSWLSYIVMIGSLSHGFTLYDLLQAYPIRFDFV